MEEKSRSFSFSFPRSKSLIDDFYGLTLNAIIFFDSLVGR